MGVRVPPSAPPTQASSGIPARPVVVWGQVPRSVRAASTPGVRDLGHLRPKSVFVFVPVVTHWATLRVDGPTRSGALVTLRVAETPRQLHSQSRRRLVYLLLPWRYGSKHRCTGLWIQCLAHRLRNGDRCDLVLTALASPCLCARLPAFSHGGNHYTKLI